MKQIKNVFSVNFQIRWERGGKSSRLDWRLIVSLLAIVLRLILPWIVR